MGMSELSETIEEIEIFCDYCGKSLGFIKWFEDLTVPCPPCCKKQTPTEAEGTHKMLCFHCRITNT